MPYGSKIGARRRVGLTFSPRFARSCFGEGDYPVSASNSLYETLGGAGVFRPRRGRSEDLLVRVREGLPYSALEEVMQRFDLTRRQVSVLLQLPERTLARRKRERRLHPDESDRLVRLARVASQAADTLGSAERAAVWLRRPNRSLGGDTPLSLLDTDLGARWVEQVLGRLEHGVPS